MFLFSFQFTQAVMHWLLYTGLRRAVVAHPRGAHYLAANLGWFSTSLAEGLQAPVVLCEFALRCPPLLNPLAHKPHPATHEALVVSKRRGQPADQVEQPQAVAPSV